MVKQLPVLAVALVLTSTTASEAAEYGLGCSFPLEDERFTCHGSVLGAETRLSVYRNYLEGCQQFFGARACEQEETRRLRDNSIKPLSMVNFTAVGFHKTRTPPQVYDLLRQHWDLHRDDGQTEWWPTKLPRNNYWAATPQVTNLLVDGYELMEATLPIMKKVMEDWTGVEQRPTNMYGVRSYRNGTVITPHVDRYPLVSSVIINVDQDVEEPWPLEVIDRNGKAVNITMAPGDMILYEGHSTIHGRPFAMKGSFYANAFISFEPTGRWIHKDDGSYTGDEYPEDGVPPFLLPGSPEESMWRKEHPDGWQYHSPLGGLDVDLPKAHVAAATGNVGWLEEIALWQPDLLDAPDSNGWRPIHEAANGGHQKVVEFLLRHGADVNSETASGHTPLNLVVEDKENMKHHPIVAFLKGHGGIAHDL